MKLKNSVSGLIAVVFVCASFSVAAAVEFCGKMHKESAGVVETIPTTSVQDGSNCPYHATDFCPKKHSADGKLSNGKVCHFSKGAPLSSEDGISFFLRKDLTVRQISELPYPETDNLQTPYRWRTGIGRESIEPRPPTA